MNFFHLRHWRLGLRFWTPPLRSEHSKEEHCLPTSPLHVSTRRTGKVDFFGLIECAIILISFFLPWNDILLSPPTKKSAIQKLFVNKIWASRFILYQSGALGEVYAYLSCLEKAVGEAETTQWGLEAWDKLVNSVPQSEVWLLQFVCCVPSSTILHQLSLKIIFEPQQFCTNSF